MANRDLSSPELLLANPNQASNIFNPDGKHPIRQKNLFAVKFSRSVSADDNWNKDLTFIVKYIDRPSVEATTEQINQYNKKKIIHTGVRYNPINIYLYDTADNAAMNMWERYARYYFSDYSQGPNTFGDDILNDALNDPSLDKQGWGFKIRPVQEGLLDGGIDSQHFFTNIEVFQVWGNEYTSYKLINPRINTFSPDELDYSISDPSTISMNISYEAIHHTNSGRPQNIFEEETLLDIFDNEFNGNTPEIPSNGPPVSFVTDGTDFSAPQEINNFSFQAETEENITRGDATSNGVLQRFGSFDFGNSQFTRQTGLAAQRTSDTLVGQVGEELLSLRGVATGINRAAQLTNTSAIDQISTSDGVSLSELATHEINRSNDGTFLFGFRR